MIGLKGWLVLLIALGLFIYFVPQWIIDPTWASNATVAAVEKAVSDLRFVMCVSGAIVMIPMAILDYVLLRRLAKE